MDDRDDDDLRLPSAVVLDTWTVPEPHPDLAERIADAWQAERIARAAPPRRRRYAGVFAGAAFGAAAAIAVMLLVRPPPSEPAEAPADLPETPAVVAPTPAEAPAKARVALRVEPGPAIVTVDGEEISGADGGRHFGFVTTPGVHNVVARQPGYALRLLELEVPPEGYAGTITLERSEFILELDVEPDDAQVRVEMAGRTVADVAGDSRLLLPREPFEAFVSAPHYAPVTVHGGPEMGPETKLDVRLEKQTPEPRARSPFRSLFKRKPKAHAGSGDLKNPFARDDDPPKSATLRIGTSSGAAPARVYVDGVYVGTTPIQKLEITPGTHTVEWYWDDGKIVSERVEIDAGDTRVLKRG